MKVKAIDSFSYASKPYIIGDEFDMPEKDAKLLSECISPRVVILEAKVLSQAEQDHLRPKIETTEMKAEEPAQEEAEPEKARAVRSRKYMRRDMTPQE